MSWSTRKNKRVLFKHDNRKKTSIILTEIQIPSNTAAQNLGGKFFLLLVQPRLALYMVVILNIDSCTSSLLACLLKRSLTIRNPIIIVPGCPVPGLSP